MSVLDLQTNEKQNNLNKNKLLVFLNSSKKTPSKIIRTKARTSMYSDNCRNFLITSFDHITSIIRPQALGKPKTRFRSY